MNLTLMNQETKMSSLEIAEICEKEHKNVLVDIRKMFESLDDFNSADFSAQYIDPTGRSLPCYYLNFELTTTLMSGYNIALRHKIVKRWMELEQEKNKIPQTLPEALRLAADLAEENSLLANQLEEAKPAVEFMGRYVESASLKNFREVSKILGVKEQDFINYLIDSKIVFRSGGNGVILPMANYQHKGLFDVKTGEKHGHAYHQTRFTTEGIAWIAKRVAKLQQTA